MATLTGKLVADTYKALLKLIDNDILTASEKQISDGFGGGSNVFIDQNGFLRAAQFKVTGGNSSQFLKGDGSLDTNTYLPTGTTTSAIAEGSRLYFTTARVLNTTLTGFVATAGTVTASDTILTAIDKIWWNIVNGGGGGGGYVPYTGATQNLNLGTYGLISDFVQFNTTNSAIPVTAGTMSWNNTDGTADLRLKGGNVTLQVGQEQVTRVVNKTGDDLLEENYQAVYISGAQGQRLKVDLALAVTDATSAGTLGLVTEDIDNNQEGFITTSGLVNKIDTTGDLQGETWADGDILYLSPLVAGQITNVKPLAPDHTVIMGFVVYAHANNGKIYVKVDNGYEIEELHDVQVIDRTDEDILQWYEDDLVWRNINLSTAITNAGGISGLGDINYVPKFDTVNSITNSLIYDDGSQVFINDDGSYYSVNSKLTVVGGNLTVDDNWGIHLGLYQILFRYDVTGELRFGTGVLNDYITFFANSTEKARLSALGYLGVGLTAPSSIIHAKDSTAYGKIIIDNTGATGGGSFSARQNGTETAIFGISGAWQANTTSDAAIVATRAGQGIKFYTDGSATAKGGIDSVGDSFIGQLPAYYAGATNFIVQGISAAALIGITHADNSIKGVFSTLNSGVNIGSETPHPVIFRADDIESARIASDGKWLFGTNVNDNVNTVQVNGSIIATTLKKTGGTSSEYLKADGSVSTLTNPVTGTGTANYIPKFTSGSTIGNSLVYDNGTSVGIGTTTLPSIYKLVVNGALNTFGAYIMHNDSGNFDVYSTISILTGGMQFNRYVGVNIYSANTNPIKFSINSGEVMRMFSTKNISINSTVDAGYRLDVNGTARVSGVLTLSSTISNGTYTYTLPSATGTLALTSDLASYVPTSRSITINGTAFDLSVDRTYSVGTVTSVSGTGTVSGLTLTGTVTTTGSLTLGGTLSLTSLNVTTALGYTPVTNARTLTINGTTYDLTADRSWTIAAGISTLTTTGTSGPATLVGSTLNVPNYSAGASAVRNVSTFTATSGQTTFTIVGGYTVGLIDVFINGARLSTADYTATNSSTVVLGTGAVLNDIVDVINYTATFTAGISGTGTTNFLTKWTGTSTVSNSLIYDNGTNVGIGTTSATRLLTIQGGTSNAGLQVLSTNGYRLGLIAGNASSGVGLDQGYFEMTNQGTAKIALNTAGVSYINGGNFGINTSSPSYKFHLIGGSEVGSRFIVDGTYAPIQFSGDNGTTIGGINAYSSRVVFGRGTSTGVQGDFIINSNGVFGFNVVPQSWYTIGSTVIQFSTGGALWGFGASNNLFSSNEYLDTSGNSRYIANDNATRYQQNAGRHVWSYASAGTAGNLISYSEAMRILSDGKVCINRTSGDGVLNLSGTFYMYGMSSGAGTSTLKYNTGTGLVSFDTSARIFKKDIINLEYGLKSVLKMCSKKYKWKSNNLDDLGFIADEMYQIIPEVVYLADNKLNPTKLKDGEPMGINYDRLVPVLVKAIQELKSELDQLKAK
jgi:hypothetical protein